MPDNSYDSPILKEIRDNFRLATEYWAPIRKEAEEDIRYATDGPWSDKEKDERAGRVTLVLDELGQYLNQIVNEFRQSRRSVKVNPRGNGANDETAQYRAGIIRDIEYDCKAQQAYVSAGNDMVTRGYGFVKLKTDWEPGSMRRVLKVCRIPNPDVVLLDPDFKEADASDASFSFEIEEGVREAEFRRRYGKKTRLADFDSSGIGDTSLSGWISDGDGGRRVRLAAYYKRVPVPKTLYLLEDGSEVASTKEQPLQIFEQGKEKFAAVNGAAVKVIDSREDNDYKVVQYITNGLEVLEENETDFSEVPHIPFFGKEVWKIHGGKSRRFYESAVRHARDAYKAYCYVGSGVVERLGMDPKTPYEGWEGQFDTATDWPNVNKSPVGYVEFKLVELPSGEIVRDKPTRNLTEPQVNQYLGACEFFRRGIQAGMGGSPLPTSAQRQNQKSGVALDKIEQSQDQGNFHFTDSYNRALERCGRMMDAALDIVYDTPREVGFRSEDEQYKVLPINQRDEAGQPVGFHLGSGNHGVTISTGPSMQSQRDEADNFLNTLAGNEAIFPRVADLVVKMKNLGPIGDQIAQRLAPPGSELPPEIAGQMQQAQQTIGQLQQEVQALKTGEAIKKYTVDEQEKTKRVLGLAQLDQKDALVQLEQMLGTLSEKFDRLHDAHKTSAQMQHEHELAERAHERAQEIAAQQPQEETL